MDITRVGLFGGSFDPPTKAHLAIAERLIERDIVDEVHFIPAYKSYHGKDYGATPEQRLDMLELLIDTSRYADSGVLQISDYEIKNKLNSSTYDYVTKFLESVSDVDDIDLYAFSFIIGMDNAMMMDKFINWTELIRTIPFIVVGRGDVVPLGCEWFIQDPHKCVDLGDDYKNASSSSIRHQIANLIECGLDGRFFDMCYLNVFAYILNYELYGVLNENC